jgi:hypothetical protein
MPFDAIHFVTNSYQIEKYVMLKPHENILLDDIVRLINQHVSTTM